MILRFLLLPTYNTSCGLDAEGGCCGVGCGAGGGSIVCGAVACGGVVGGGDAPVNSGSIAK